MSQAIPVEKDGLPPAPPASPRQVVLGFFILFQLAFLFVSNLLGFVKWAPSELGPEARERINQVLPQFADKEGHAWHWADEIETGIRRWVQLTGQDQEWSLFAPTVGKATAFPAVLFVVDGATPDDASIHGAEFTFDANNGFHMNVPQAEILLSENEPKDVRAFFRYGKCRVRRYEGQFYLNPQPYEAEKPEDVAARLNRRVQTMAKDYHDAMIEYLHWRLKAWQSEHRDQPEPTQVILLERFYRTHGPDEPRGWDDPVVIPLVRWRPKRERSAHSFSLEAFDFVERRFAPLK